MNSFDFLYSVLIYLVTFFSSTWCIYHAEKKKHKKKIWDAIGIIIPTLTAAFRQSGIDYFSYELIYGYIRGGGNYSIEPFWYLLNRIMPTYEWLLFASALIFCGVAYFSICKYIEKKRWIAWFIFLMVCYAAFYNGMRQMLAVVFVFGGFYYLLNKEKLKFFLFVFVACMFHKSTLFVLLIPVYLFIVRRIKEKEIFILVLTIVVVVCLPVFELVLNKIGLYSGYISRQGGNMNFGFLLYTLPPLFFYYKRKKLCIKDELVCNSLSLYLLTIPFQFLGMKIAYADRMMLYFQIMIVVLIPQVISCYDERIKKHSLRGMYVIWFIFHYVVLFIILNGSGTYPYRIF